MATLSSSQGSLGVTVSLMSLLFLAGTATGLYLSQQTPFVGKRGGLFVDSNQRKDEEQHQQERHFPSENSFAKDDDDETSNDETASSSSSASSTTSSTISSANDSNAMMDEEEEDDDDDDHMARDDKEEEPVHSVLHHFASLQLDPQTTVEEANKRRTASYYLKAREAHARQIVPGVRASVSSSSSSSYEQLMTLRHQHVERNLRYSHMGTHSHRTIVAMCDASTATLLHEARQAILAPLQYSHDIQTRGCWIPSFDVIPPQDMHVTVAIPWWWHSMRPGNAQLSQELAARFRQTLFLQFHHPFQVELQQIVLLGGQTLVALWRCVGERVTEEGHVVYDRRGESTDPFVRLRVEIVRCFTKRSSDNRLKPLTYQDVIQQQQEQCEMQENDIPTTSTHTSDTLPPTPSRPNGRPPLTREHSIELKTPGLGSGDGFIHTTLCRLPLDCLSNDDVSLAQVHRLCRELTHTLSGHRMVISKFRFLETVGRGGLSNPCVEPIYDETIEAPTRFKVKPNGHVNEIANLHLLPQEMENNRTIGAIRNRKTPGSLEGLFSNPGSPTNTSSSGSSPKNVEDMESPLPTAAETLLKELFVPNSTTTRSLQQELNRKVASDIANVSPLPVTISATVVM